jgi:hypothetical protein
MRPCRLAGGGASLFAAQPRHWPSTQGFQDRRQPWKGSVVSNDNDRIGLSGSTPEGQEVRLAAGLSDQTGRRRTAAKAFALVWLAGIGVAIVVVAVNLLT